MLGPVFCGHVSVAPLLPKLRGHFAEFLNNASPAGLGLLDLSTCVGLRYGSGDSYSGFSRRLLRTLRYSFSLRITHCLSAEGFASLPRLVLAPCFLSGLVRPFRVPTVLCHRSTGFSTCIPSPTRLRLGLGPGLPREDQLYPGTLGHPAWMIPTSISLLIPAFSLRYRPLLLPVQLRPVSNAPLPVPLARRQAYSTASVACFSPVYFRRGTSRLVSYYALFECVAASEPTS